MSTKTRTRTETYGRCRDLIDAAEVRRVRAAVGMSQARFAAVLGIHPRTVVRGEARGLEIPSRVDTRRPEVRAAWLELQVQAGKQKPTPTKRRI